MHGLHAFVRIFIHFSSVAFLFRIHTAKDIIQRFVLFSICCCCCICFWCFLFVCVCAAFFFCRCLCYLEHISFSCALAQCSQRFAHLYVLETCWRQHYIMMRLRMLYLTIHKMHRGCTCEFSAVAKRIVISGLATAPATASQPPRREDIFWVNVLSRASILLSSSQYSNT